MHSDFYDNPASEIIKLRDEVSKLRRNVDALKKYARMVTELYTELNGKNKELSAQLGKDTNVPRWISVDERLPESDGKYIVCTAKGSVYCTRFKKFVQGGNFQTDVNTHVTHWMPLPEPPKEG